MDIHRISVQFLCVISLIGYVSCATPPSSPGCFTQPPGRGNNVMTCKDKYAVLPDNLYCLKNIQRHALPDSVINEILNKHNEIRSLVSPKAANMLELKYSGGLGRTAQVWAEMCELQPSKILQRFRPGSFQVGENIYVSKTNISWSDVINEWTKENSTFTYDAKNDLTKVSNYTQLVWANTSAVGCAMAFCAGRYYYVCHYAPAMVYSNIDQPYQSSKASCSQCTNCTSLDLCDCVGVICLNGGQLNYTTCQCDCITEVKTYMTPTCDLECIKDGDDPKCGTKYHKSTCLSDIETMYHCPWLCDICPYASKDHVERSELLPWERNRTACTSGPATTSRKNTGSTQSPTREASRATNNPSKQGTTTAMKSSNSKQLNGHCGNGSSGILFSPVVLSAMLIMMLLNNYK